MSWGLFRRVEETRWMCSPFRLDFSSLCIVSFTSRASPQL